MPPVRPHLSVTLPKNFTFHYTDGSLPKTPEPEDKEEPTEPPQIPRQGYRVRRRRRALPSYAPTNFAHASRDIPIPTIDAPEPETDATFARFGTPFDAEDGFLKPAPTIRPISPPKTPVGQIGMSPNDLGSFDSEIDGLSQAEIISRPSSSCSGISDSSISSRDSMGSSDSAGSCTSPESDSSDPFVFPETKGNKPFPSSPLQAYNERPAKRMKTRKDAVWTKSMDDHLWFTYMMCLQDPTVTPFKMLPGTVPPLGICARVARLAKKSWKGSSAIRSTVASPDASQGSWGGSDSSNLLRIPKSGSKWPRSEAAARGRLRKLCKRQPMLAAHYQRLLRTRTPSPFPSSSPPTASAVAPAPMNAYTERKPSEAPSFSTRDMSVSLSTSTSTMMQAGNPLHKLATESTPQMSLSDFAAQQQSPRSHAHQKSQSLQFGPGFGSPASREGSKPTLASPFSATSSKGRSNGSAEASRPVSQPLPRLDPPVELHAPVPITRFAKRRAQQYLEDMANAENNGGQSFLNQLFGAPAEISHRRVRSRGFSLGDMDGGARQLSSLFTPPASFEQADDTMMGAEPTGQSYLAPPAQVDPERRLGSPFCGKSSNNFSTFPRMSGTSRFEPAASFEERFNGLFGA
ncbi:hypothetical protein IWZ01DRAFT_65157 [Phyllosticta capitalensis]